MHHARFRIACLTGLWLVAAQALAQFPDPERFEEAILAFEANDRNDPPPEGAIVLTGSSSIARWNDQAAAALAPLTVIPRGFGGSVMHDVLHYLDRIALVYEPRAILIYEGDNDTGQRNPIPTDLILADLESIIARVHEALPETRIYVLSVKPSILRRGAWPAAQEVSMGYRAIAEADPLVYYVDVATPFLNPDGSVMTDIFVSDNLHLNDLGNAIWGATIKAALMPMEARHEGRSCNRDCLLEAADDYLHALVAHDPSAVPLADDIAFVENIARLSPGQGLWQSAVAPPGSFAIYVPDETRQSVGFLGMMTRMAAPPAPQEASAEERAQFAASAQTTEQPALVAIRLRLDNGRIVEAEHLITGVRDAFLANLTEPRSGLVTEVPPGNRMSHAALIEIGASYYDALDDNDGTLMPFAPDCLRQENGMITAGAGAGAGPNNAGTGQIARDCAGQLSSNVMAYIDRIENRRVFAADPVTGLVMGLSHFRHPMDGGPWEVTTIDGKTEMHEVSFAPFDLPAAHVFKIGADGLVHEIEAMGFMAPYDSPTGWE
jgi:lysophospholipase L1-like esterase